MAGYYTLDIEDITRQRRGNDKQPFPHQRESFAALSKTMTTPIRGYKGTLLVLPTGGGKTYTSINWICRNILTKGAKVLWLAQSAYLIDQAADTFIKEIHNALGRKAINLRVVSSSKNHSNAGSILLTDDIVVSTTQTAISAYWSEQLDGKGNMERTPFRKFVDNCSDTELFVVVDEAHHTPAYGCRTLLLSMREKIENLYILGLTATPIHMDKRVSGWLKNIYDQWVCYEADKNVLQANKVLSVPKYIEKKTGVEFEVDDGLFERLVNKHKDLPDTIIENLANNQSRNNFIISDYINNRSEYGKTLIFADRWFQCEYIVEKLKEKGVRANAVYSIVTGQDEVYRAGSGRRNDEMNRQIMQDFREGKYDVIANVRMLTEGVDVPDVKTVMITRQTTSNILLTQMIGRALRGEKAGGGKSKDYANIVFFHDTWKRLLPWADTEGGMEAGRPVRQGMNPMSLVSIHLVQMATEDIKYTGFENAEFLTFIPVGFFGCEYTVAVEEGEELVSFAESIIVYEFNKSKYEKLIDFLLNQNLTQYAAENLSESQIEGWADELSLRFFDTNTDNFDGLLINNISKIIRHMAQNDIKPAFIDFHERDVYDLDKLAEELLNTPPLDADMILTNKFNDMGLYWNFLYKGFDNFMDAYYKSQKRVLAKLRGQPQAPIVKPNGDSLDELTEEIKKQVFLRDNYTCLCCGKEQRKGVSLNADHIRPVAMGGTNAVSNLQTLCKRCNMIKGLNEIDYRVHATPLREPKPELILFDSIRSDYVENTIFRIVNAFYHCGALCAVHIHKKRSGKYYYAWELELYSGNKPEWLEIHEDKLLDYIHNRLGLEHVTELIFKN